MASSLTEVREFARMAAEGLSRYRLRTSLSVLGVVLGVAAVIAMTSVSEGAAREALAQVDALGLDNLVARNTGMAAGQGRPGLVARDVQRAGDVVPLVRAASPLIAQYLRISRGEQSFQGQIVGVLPSYDDILRLTVEHGRFLAPTDEQTQARSCVLGGQLARRLFGFRNPVGEGVRLGQHYYQVVGVLNAQGSNPGGGNTFAWRDVNQTAFVPFSTLSQRPLAFEPDQPADEIWIQIAEGDRAEQLGRLFERVLGRNHPASDYTVVIPRELLAQRYRTQRTFSIVVGSIGALALLIGGIGIMNIMLASVIERTHEIGIRRTVGATQRDVALQFLMEALIMTLSGGATGIVLGAVAAFVISNYAGWTTHVSLPAVGLGFGVSVLVGLTFGLYPAIKAAALEPIDAMRYE